MEPKKGDQEDKTRPSAVGPSKRSKGVTFRKPGEVTDISQLSPEDILKLVNDLKVHQIELQVQNEELVTIREDLRESLDRYLDLYNSSPVSYFTLEKDSSILEVNQTAVELLGVPRQQLLKEKFTGYISQESQDTFFLRSRKAFETGVWQNCEVRMRKKDGSLFDTRLEGKIVKSMSDNSNVCRIAIIDITEQKRLEKAEELALDKVESSKDYLEAVLRTMPSGVVIIEKPDGKVTYVNVRACQLYGCDPRGLEMKRHSNNEMKLLKLDGSTFPPEELPASRALLQGETVHNEELIIERSDGTRKVVSASASPLFDKNGEPYSAVGIFDDITERKLMEEALIKAKKDLEIQVEERTADLKKSEEAYRRIIETSNEGIWILDTEGKVLFANDRVSEILGYSKEEIIGRTTFDFLAECEKEPVIKMAEDLRKGTKVISERQLLHKDGTIVWVLVSSFPIFDSNGNHVNNMGMFADITEQKRLRNERQQFTKKLIQVQEEERKRISRDLHDETAQKIALIILELDSLCLKEKLPREIAARLKKIREVAGNTLQEVRRFSHELRPSVLEHFGLAEALELIIDEMNVMGQTEVSISVTGSERRLSEEAEVALFRIAQETLSNIRKHSGATKAKVNIAYTPKKVKVTISDNGLGFNINNKSDDFCARGLGLVGMRERARLIGAKLQIKSLEGIGTTVSVELPSEI